jgi:NAD-dependent DNA ligase
MIQENVQRAVGSTSLAAMVDNNLISKKTAIDIALTKKIPSFAITGTLSKVRQEFMNAIARMGWIYHASVRQDTTILLAGTDQGKVKLKAAQRFGVAQISESTFWSMVDGKIDPIEYAEIPF